MVPLHRREVRRAQYHGRPNEVQLHPDLPWYGAHGRGVEHNREPTRTRQVRHAQERDNTPPQRFSSTENPAPSGKGRHRRSNSVAILATHQDAGRQSWADDQSQIKKPIKATVQITGNKVPPGWLLHQTTSLAAAGRITAEEVESAIPRKIKHDIVHYIETMPGPPTFYKPQRLSAEMYKMAHAEFSELMNQEYIRPRASGLQPSTWFRKRKIDGDPAAIIAR
ncbi:hypothetical protein K0M31_002288 [Melipona bicolor]|uniref:Uncharacterized protein n=1 Tax=Melipona bicolor TaxID=60889 RepID=A0AA40KYE6_9HYME|nr:hypothetical protein K0M31_002288 [Melipona bicolor]